MSSAELIEQAWRDIGRGDPDTPRDQSSSESATMASSANAASTASSEARTLAAEEIARLLREEEQGREAAARPAQPARPRRAAPTEIPPPLQVPPPRQGMPPRQDVPSRQGVPSRRLPPPQVPSPDGPRSGQAPSARGSRPRVGWLVFLVIAALGSVFSRFADDPIEVSDSPATTAVVIPESSLITDRGSLEPGLCLFRLPPSGGGSFVTVPCNAPHLYEVFAIVESVGPSVNAGGPAQAQLIDEQTCFERFSAYVGEDYDVSPWYLAVIRPTETEWVEQRVRTAVCLVHLQRDDAPAYASETARDSGGA